MRWNNGLTTVADQVASRNVLLQYTVQQINSDCGSPGRVVMNKQMQQKVASILANIAKRQVPQHWSTFAEDVLALADSVGGSSGARMAATNISLLIFTNLLQDCLSNDFNGCLPSQRKHDLVAVIQHRLMPLMQWCHRVVCEYANMYVSLPTVTSAGGADAASLVNNALLMLIPLVTLCKTPNEICGDNAYGCDFVPLILQCLSLPVFQEAGCQLLQCVAGCSNKLSYAVLMKLLVQLPQCSIVNPGGVVKIDEDCLHVHKLFAGAVFSLLADNLSAIGAQLEVQHLRGDGTLAGALRNYFSGCCTFLLLRLPCRRLVQEGAKDLTKVLRDDAIWKHCGGWLQEFCAQVLLPSLCAKCRQVRWTVDKYNGAQDEEPIEEEEDCSSRAPVHGHGWEGYSASLEFDNVHEYTDFMGQLKASCRIMLGVVAAKAPAGCVEYVGGELRRLVEAQRRSADYLEYVMVTMADGTQTVLQLSTTNSSSCIEWASFQLLLDCVFTRLQYTHLYDVSGEGSGDAHASTRAGISSILNTLVELMGTGPQGQGRAPDDALMLLAYIRCIDSASACLPHVCGAAGDGSLAPLLSIFTHMLDKLYYCEECAVVTSPAKGGTHCQRRVDVSVEAAADHGLEQYVREVLLDDRQQQVRKRAAGAISFMCGNGCVQLLATQSELLSQLFNTITAAIASRRLSHLQQVSLYESMVAVFEQIPAESGALREQILHQVVDGCIAFFATPEVRALVGSPERLLLAACAHYSDTAGTKGTQAKGFAQVQGAPLSENAIFLSLLNNCSLLAAIARKVAPPVDFPDSVFQYPPQAAQLADVDGAVGERFLFTQVWSAVFPSVAQLHSTLIAMWAPKLRLQLMSQLQSGSSTLGVLYNMPRRQLNTYSGVHRHDLMARLQQVSPSIMDAVRVGLDDLRSCVNSLTHCCIKHKYMCWSAPVVQQQVQGLFRGLLTDLAGLEHLHLVFLLRQCVEPYVLNSPAAWHTQCAQIMAPLLGHICTRIALTLAAEDAPATSYAFPGATQKEHSLLAGRVYRECSISTDGEESDALTEMYTAEVRESCRTSIVHEFTRTVGDVLVNVVGAKAEVVHSLAHSNAAATDGDAGEMESESMAGLDDHCTGDNEGGEDAAKIARYNALLRVKQRRECLFSLFLRPGGDNQVFQPFVRTAVTLLSVPDATTLRCGAKLISYAMEYNTSSHVDTTAAPAPPPGYTPEQLQQHYLPYTLQTQKQCADAYRQYHQRMLEPLAGDAFRLLVSLLLEDLPGAASAEMDAIDLATEIYYRYCICGYEGHFAPGSSPATSGACANVPPYVPVQSAHPREVLLTLFQGVGADHLTAFEAGLRAQKARRNRRVVLKDLLTSARELRRARSDYDRLSSGEVVAAEVQQASKVADVRTASTVLSTRELRQRQAAAASAETISLTGLFDDA